MAIPGQGSPQAEIALSGWREWAAALANVSAIGGAILLFTEVTVTQVAITLGVLAAMLGVAIIWDRNALKSVRDRIRVTFALAAFAIGVLVVVMGGAPGTNANQALGDEPTTSATPRLSSPTATAPLAPTSAPPGSTYGSTTGPQPAPASCRTAPHPFPQSNVVATIEAPRAEGVVPRVVNAGGMLPVNLAGRRAWTVVEVVGPEGNVHWEKIKCSSNRFWPGAAPIEVGADGRWSTEVIFGSFEASSVGLRFRLTIIVANAPASEQLVQYNKTAPPGYPGILTGAIVGTYEAAISVEVTRGQPNS